MERFQVASPVSAGKHFMIPGNKREIYVDVAHYLGGMHWLFMSGTIEKNDIKHFTVNVDHKSALGSSGQKGIKYADVVSWGERFTILVHSVAGGMFELRFQLWFSKTTIGIPQYVVFLVIYH